MDANETIVFARQLEHVKKTTYDIVYPELKARKFIPPAAEPADNTARTITYEQFDRVGMARLIASYADDLPRVDVFGREFTSPIRPIGVAYAYNLQEARESVRTGRSLPTMRANTARKAAEEQIDELLAFGDVATGIPGFLNAAAVPAASVATVGAATTWADKAAVDPEDVINDVLGAINDMVALTNGQEYPDTALFPEEQFSLISTKKLIGETTTILEFLQSKLKRITTWEPWHKLAGAGAGGTDRFMLYKRSNDKCGYEVPQEFEQLDVQDNNLEYKVPCHARVGGTVFMYPLSATYRDGI